jgi:Transglycosylase SLT domain
MSVETTLKSGASLLFDDDPLVNMAASGLYKGASFLGRAAKNGLQRLKTTPESQTDTDSSPPARENGAGVGEDWTWLKSILSEISVNIASLKSIGIDQQNFQEKSSLEQAENRNEDQNQREILFGKINTIIDILKRGGGLAENKQNSGGILGFLGSLAAGLNSTFSTIANGLLTAGNAMLTAFNSLVVFLPTVIRAFSFLLPVLSNLGLAAISAYAALKLMQKLAPGMNDLADEKTKDVGTDVMNWGDRISWLKSKLTGEENYTGYYQKLFSQESPEKSMFTEGILGGVNEYLDPQYKEKRDKTNKVLRVQSEKRAQIALDEDIKGRETRLKELDNVPDMMGPDGKISENSASIQREKLKKEIEQLKNKKQQFEQYLSLKTSAGLEGRWIESVLDKESGKMVNNPLADASKYLTKEDYQRQIDSSQALKDSNDELKSSIDALKDLLNSGGTGIGGAGSGLSYGFGAGMDTGDNYLNSLIRVESGGNPNAKNPLSSAGGLGQITDGTWMDATRQMGVNWPVSDKFDPQKNLAVTKFLTEQNRSLLASRLGRNPSNAELYMGHFMGPETALTFAQQMSINPNASAAGMFPKEARANPSIFNGRSLQQVFDLMSNKINGNATKLSQLAANGNSSSTNNVFSFNTAAAPQGAPPVASQTESTPHSAGAGINFNVPGNVLALLSK